MRNQTPGCRTGSCEKPQAWGKTRDPSEEAGTCPFLLGTRLTTRPCMSAAFHINLCCGPRILSVMHRECLQRIPPGIHSAPRLSWSSLAGGWFPQTPQNLFWNGAQSLRHPHSQHLNSQDKYARLGIASGRSLTTALSPERPGWIWAEASPPWVKAAAELLKRGKLSV